MFNITGSILEYNESSWILENTNARSRISYDRCRLDNVSADMYTTAVRMGCKAIRRITATVWGKCVYHSVIFKFFFFCQYFETGFRLKSSEYDPRETVWFAFWPYTYEQLPTRFPLGWTYSFGCLSFDLWFGQQWESIYISRLIRCLRNDDKTVLRFLEIYFFGSA